VIPWLALLAAGGLLGAGATKGVLLLRGRLDWPPLRPLGIPIGPLPVAAGEVLVAAAAAVAPPSTAAGLLAAAYLGLTCAAAALLGRECACFGGRGVVSPIRVGLNAVIAAVMAVIAIVSGEGPPVGVRAAVVGGVAVVVVAVSLRRAADAPDEASTPTDPARIATLTIVVSPDCPACARLRARLRDYPPHWIDWQDSGSGSWAEQAKGTYPCAIATDAAGVPLGAPRWGVSSIAELADGYAAHRITAGS